MHVKASAVLLTIWCWLQLQVAIYEPAMPPLRRDLLGMLVLLVLVLAWARLVHGSRRAALGLATALTPMQFHELGQGCLCTPVLADNNMLAVVVLVPALALAIRGTVKPPPVLDRWK